jgi:hypothetical protein
LLRLALLSPPGNGFYVKNCAVIAANERASRGGPDLQRASPIA